MSFTTSTAIWHGILPLLTEGPVRSYGPRGVLDTATFEVLVDAAFAEDQLAGLGFVADAKLSTYGLHSMWVGDMKDEIISPLVIKYTVEAHGLIKPGEKRRRRILPLFGSVYQGGEPTGGGTFGSTSMVSDYTVFQMVDTYFQEEVPDYTVIGREITPPDAVGGPTIERPGTVPSGYTVGWNLASRIAEHLYEGLYRVEDIYSYSQYQPA